MSFQTTRDWRENDDADWGRSGNSSVTFRRPAYNSRRDKSFGFPKMIPLGRLRLTKMKRNWITQQETTTVSAYYSFALYRLEYNFRNSPVRVSYLISRSFGWEYRGERTRKIMRSICGNIDLANNIISFAVQRMLAKGYKLHEPPTLEINPAADNQ